jgi:hypothetical protein
VLLRRAGRPDLRNARRQWLRVEATPLEPASTRPLQLCCAIFMDGHQHLMVRAEVPGRSPWGTSVRS